VSSLQKKFFMNKKHWFIIYIIATLALSLYIHFGAETLWEFLLVSLVTSGLFIGIYFCFRGFRGSSTGIKSLRVVGVLVCLALIWASAAYASVRQFNSHACKDIAGENIFTGKTKAYCNFIPWYTKQTYSDRFQTVDFIRVPGDGIKQVRTGYIYTIAWPLGPLTPENSEKVTITLTNVSYPHKIQKELFKDIPTNRLVQWTIPTDLPDSNQYKLHVYSCSYSAAIPDCTSLGEVSLDISSEAN